MACERGAANGAAVRHELSALVSEAVVAGQLRSGTKPDGLARAIETTINGSIMTWAVYQQGKEADWIDVDIDALLESVIPEP